MRSYKIEVIQHSKVVRTCVIEVEAEDAETAVEKLEDGEIDVPHFEDPRWIEVSCNVSAEMYEPQDEGDE